MAHPDRDDIAHSFVGSSAAAKHIRETIVAIAPSNVPVLIVGETGTGKEIVARLLHEHGKRSGAPFVVINCAALPVSLAQAELFGFVKGAFTGAERDRKGLFESASGGTLFLDEIESLPLEIQAALLRIIDESIIRRIGSDHEISIDVRIVSATNSDLSKLAREGKLRSDLIDRLGLSLIRVPPLRDRLDDIPELVEHFLVRMAKDQSNPISIEKDALQKLTEYDYPGNVRELQAILYRAAALSDQNRITSNHIDIGRPIAPSAPSRDQSSQAEISALRREVEYLRRNSIVATPVWEGRAFPTEPEYCFVLMPFSDTMDIQQVYVDHVKMVIEKRCGLRCERADDIYDISGVMQSVWEGINRARLIVADLTGRNPNVFYELGIAHTLGKPVIMITQSMDYVPFDLRHLRCIVYDYKPSTVRMFETALEKTVRTVLSSNQTPSLDIKQA